MRNTTILAAALALCAAGASAALQEGADAIAEAILGRPLTAGERALDDRARWRAVATADELLADWIAQDERLAARETPLSVPDPAARLRAALARAGVEAAADDADWPALLARYRAACAARRARRLAALARDCPRWVFCRHYTMGGSFYAYTEAQSDALGEHFMPGLWSALCLLEARPDGFWRETVLRAAEGGCFRDAEVTPDGRRVVYAFKASGRGDDFHLYEMDLDTRATRALTGGAGYADYEPCCLPDGSILFNSTRCVQVVDCAFSDVSNIFRCDADGGNLARVTYDQVHDNFPTLGWDGKITYLRWEYNDRSQMFPQILFQMNADGTGQRAVYGENSWFPTSFQHSRAVPGSPLIYSVASGHHTHQPGLLVRVDPREGRQEGAGVYEATPEGLKPARYAREDVAGQAAAITCYPYPLSADELVAVHLPEGWPMFKDPKRQGIDAWAIREPFGVYWMNAAEGARELLLPRYGDGGRAIPPGRVVPVRAQGPVAASPAPPASPADRTKATGTFFVQDVYEGPAMAGVARGEVKTLRVVGLDYRPIGAGRNGNNGPGGGALVTTPVSIGRGAWDPKIVVGDVPVEADGSAYFEAPANLPVYFMLLDGKGRMVQTMRSWSTLQPGETATCTGCHEGQNAAPPSAYVRAAAASRAPRAPEPVLAGGVRALSFPRDVQPILDRRCGACHGAAEGKKPDLTATPVDDPIAKRRWTQSYISLTGARRWPKGEGDEFFIAPTDRKLLNWINAASEPTLLKPRSAGSATSALFTEMLDKGHARGITDAETRLLAMWTDLCVPFCGTYDEAALWGPEERALYASLLEKRARATLPPGGGKEEVE